MQLTSTVIECVKGLRGDALAKARKTGLYDRILEEAKAEKRGSFDDMKDDIPWKEDSHA